MPFQERRKYPRVSESIPCAVTLGQNSFSSKTKNLSCGGVLCLIPHSIPVMTKLEVDLKFPLGSPKDQSLAIQCTGVVVRQELETSTSGAREYLTAVYFSEIQMEDRRRIAEFVLNSMLSHARRRS